MLAAALASLAVAASSVVLGPTAADPRALVLGDPAVSPDLRGLVRHPPSPRSGVVAGTTVAADLTGDGRRELLVPVRGAGRAGVIAYFVYALLDGKVRDIFPVNDVLGARVSLRRHRIVEELPVLDPARPACVRAWMTTVYRWDGERIVRQARSTRAIRCDG